MNAQAPTQKTALVIGATGSIGGAVAEALLAHGWSVRALSRSPETAPRSGPAGVDWIRGDAMSETDVTAAAIGCQAIFHGANPPGYADWARKQPAMLEAVIGAARATGARIVFPGNVYNFGPDAWPRFDEDAPQNPRTRKGAIRVALEQRLKEVSGSGVRSLVVRAGDFFGPRSGSSWLTEGWIAKGRPVRAVNLPGPAEVRHAWAYLPDFAESIARLMDREADLPPFASFNHGGHQVTGAEMAAALERAAGRRLARRSLPWFALALASPFAVMPREMMEMRYLWDHEVLLDNRRLTGILGSEPHTPLDQALVATLRGQGCLEEEAVAA